MPKKRGRVGGRQAFAPVKRHQRKNVRPSATPDVELWTPPERPKKKVTGNRFTARSLFLKDEANEPTEGSGVATRYVNRPEVPTDDLFIAPSQSKLTNRELGFDAKGRCLYGCDGTRSIKKGYTNIAMHHYKCPFWATVDGKTQTPF